MVEAVAVESSIQPAAFSAGVRVLYSGTPARTTPMQAQWQNNQSGVWQETFYAFLLKLNDSSSLR